MSCFSCLVLFSTNTRSSRHVVALHCIRSSASRVAARAAGRPRAGPACPHLHATARDLPAGTTRRPPQIRRRLAELPAPTRRPFSAVVAGTYRSLLPWLSPVLSPRTKAEPREGDNQGRTSIGAGLSFGTVWGVLDLVMCAVCVTECREVGLTLQASSAMILSPRLLRRGCAVILQGRHTELPAVVVAVGKEGRREAGSKEGAA